jgi:hypothetical protein
MTAWGLTVLDEAGEGLTFIGEEAELLCALIQT